MDGIRVAMEHDFFRNIRWRALYSRKVEAPVRPCEGWKGTADAESLEAATQNNILSRVLVGDDIDSVFALML